MIFFRGGTTIGQWAGLSVIVMLFRLNDNGQNMTRRQQPDRSGQAVALFGSEGSGGSPLSYQLSVRKLFQCRAVNGVGCSVALDEEDAVAEELAGCAASRAFGSVQRGSLLLLQDALDMYLTIDVTGKRIGLLIQRFAITPLLEFPAFSGLQSERVIGTVLVIALALNDACPFGNDRRADRVILRPEDNPHVVVVVYLLELERCLVLEVVLVEKPHIKVVVVVVEGIGQRHIVAASVLARSVNLHQCGVNTLDRNRDAETVLLELCDVAESERSTVFANAAYIGGICAKGQAVYTRKQLDALTEFVRFVSLFAVLDSIRTGIAFPNNNQGKDVMLGAPSVIDQIQLDELQIDIRKK